MSKANKLFFRLELIDKLTQSSSRVLGKFQKLVGRTTNKINHMTRTAQKGFRNIAFGALALVGAGHAVAGAMGPALEMNRAMG